MMLVWTPEQRAVIATIVAADNAARRRSPDSCLACRVGIPTSTVTSTVTYAPQASVRERVRRRQRLAKKLVRAIGWSAR